LSPDIGLILGIAGTTTGILALIIHFLGFLQQRPQLKLVGLWLQIKRTRGKYLPRVAFTIHNVGDRPTQITSLSVSLAYRYGGIDESRVLGAHSTTRFPEGEGSEGAGDQFKGIEIKDSFFDNSDEDPQSFEEQQELNIILPHTHGSLDARYKIPPFAKWDKNNNIGKVDNWYFFYSLKKVSRLRRYISDLREKIVYRD
jgi:hypothetical protein